ncbi:hypothetical protein R3P38DRAFT_2666304 [Favolaschia claudopus]|uniref:Uncharacterized protein n=1 Tax=Favolaschia claudopus TaxID=2862362 RepID=A0AAV9ZCM2_9AGAR
MMSETMTASVPRTPQRPTRIPRPESRRTTSDSPLFVHTDFGLDIVCAAQQHLYHQELHLSRSPRLPHSPLTPQHQYRTTSPSPRAPHRTTSPRSRTPHRPLEGGELPRRHTTTTVPGSPARTERASGHTRQRSRTEPAAPPSANPTSSPHAAYEVAGAQYELAGEDRERERGRRGPTHARKSSAYAALAALSGLGVGHPSGGRSMSTSQIAHMNPNVNGYHPVHGPPTPGSTPPLSADVRDGNESGTSESEEDVGSQHDGLMIRRKARSESRGGNGRLLTPPATPPRCSLLVVADGDGGEVHPNHTHGHASPDGGSPRPAFNARKASAQCRQLEGYVSFAAVEGLGEPPSPGPDGDLADDDDAAKHKRGSLGAGIVGLWKGGFW